MMRLFGKRTDVTATLSGQGINGWAGVLPTHFDAVGEALAEGDSGRALEACWVLGGELADRGDALDQSLDRLAEVTRLVADRDPSFTEVRALAAAWSETTLGYLHGVSCSDPLTGLSTMAHLRERISAIHRGHEPVAATYALVVVELPMLSRADQIAAAGQMAVVGDSLRTVFAGPESICRVGLHRIVVLTRREPNLGRRVALARQLVGAGISRIWIEGLPASEVSAAHIIDELARCE